MSAAGSTELERLSPLVRAAAGGELPEWSVATPKRREHIGRVAALMSEWAAALDLPEVDRVRWTAAGWLHDALRDAPEPVLRPLVGAEFADFPPPLLHGPAAAARLIRDADEAILTAVRYHTTGHPGLDRMGRALYLADFLEPGRDFSIEWRASLRERMPGDLDGVVVEVLGSRLGHLVEARRPIRPETAAFWTAVVTGR